MRAPTGIQYQLWARSLILNHTLHATPGLPLGSEWERVNLAMYPCCGLTLQPYSLSLPFLSSCPCVDSCRAIWAKYDNLDALSTSLHVNGDGRSAAIRGEMPYEPGAHGTTCTLGQADFAPISFANSLPNLGPYR